MVYAMWWRSRGNNTGRKQLTKSGGGRSGSGGRVHSDHI